jgi:hypothetical protein
MTPLKRSIKKKILFLLILLAIPTLAVTGRSDYWYFKAFFIKSQPAEFYQIPTSQQYPSMHVDTKRPFLTYTLLEDFATPNSWFINFTKDMMSFDNPYFNRTPDPKENYLNWRTLDPKQQGYAKAALPVTQSYSANPIVNLLGVRALFFNNNVQKITLVPKKPMYLNKARKIRTIQLFVLGLEKNYTMYIDVSDPNGDIHRLYLGKLNFSGWKQMRVDLKDYHIPDNPRDFVLGTTQFLELKRIVFESNDIYTRGFFGTWISDLRYGYYRDDSPTDSGSALFSQFHWKGSAPVRGLEPVQGANADASGDTQTQPQPQQVRNQNNP